MFSKSQNGLGFGCLGPGRSRKKRLVGYLRTFPGPCLWYGLGCNHYSRDKAVMVRITSPSWSCLLPLDAARQCIMPQRLPPPSSGGCGMTFEVENSESWSHRFPQEAPLHVHGEQMEMGEGGRARAEPTSPRAIWAPEGNISGAYPTSLPLLNLTHTRKPEKGSVWGKATENQ